MDGLRCPRPRPESLALYLYANRFGSSAVECNTPVYTVSPYTQEVSSVKPLPGSDMITIPNVASGL